MYSLQGYRKNAVLNSMGLEINCYQTSWATCDDVLGFIVNIYDQHAMYGEQPTPEARTSRASNTWVPPSDVHEQEIPSTERPQIQGLPKEKCRYAKNCNDDKHFLHEVLAFKHEFLASRRSCWVALEQHHVDEQDQDVGSARRSKSDDIHCKESNPFNIVTCLEEEEEEEDIRNLVLTPPSARALRTPGRSLTGTQHSAMRHFLVTSMLNIFREDFRSRIEGSGKKFHGISKKCIKCCRYQKALNVEKRHYW
ncbi:hypothetical protein C0J52_26600 [Blattella germanica]|nr:hypothetical protein C0J52_26600 [Blattella germanica]